MSKDDKIVQAFLENESLNETAEYLRRGRVFESVDNDGLRGAWLNAFREWWRLRAEPAQRLMDDLAAEMRLRNISPPYDQIEKEQLQMRNEMISMGPGNEEVRKRIAAFLNEREEPQN